MPRADWMPVAAAFYDVLTELVDTGKIVEIQLRTGYQFEGTIGYEDPARLLFTCVAKWATPTGGQNVRITFSSADVAMVLRRTPAP